MKINSQDFNDLAGLRPTGSTEHKTDKSARTHEKNIQKDTVDTSRMSHIMSKNARELASIKNIRYDKIEALKYIVNKEPDFSDSVIDKILHKLTSA